MPELPEVETIKRILSDKLIKTTFVSVIINKERHLKDIKSSEFIKKITGQRINDIKRKGKWLFFMLDDYILAVHLRMTGIFLFNKIKEKVPALSFRLKNDKRIEKLLFYYDYRGWGVFYLKPINLLKELSFYKNIGPDLLLDNIDGEQLFSLTRNKKKNIKSFLLDQKNLSGIGNIYAAEILFAAKIHPLTKVNRLKINDWDLILKKGRFIINRAILNKGTSVSNFLNPFNKLGENQFFLKVYKRENKPCLECESLLINIKINSRSNVLCPNCQLKIE